jgi:hypothetical protein
MFFLSLSIVLFDLDNFLFVPARLVVHLIFFLLGRNPPTATFGHFFGAAQRIDPKSGPTLRWYALSHFDVHNLVDAAVAREYVDIYMEKRCTYLIVLMLPEFSFSLLFLPIKSRGTASILYTEEKVMGGRRSFISL